MSDTVFNEMMANVKIIYGDDNCAYAKAEDIYKFISILKERQTREQMIINRASHKEGNEK